MINEKNISHDYNKPLFRFSKSLSSELFLYTSVITKFNKLIIILPRVVKAK